MPNQAGWCVTAGPPSATSSCSTGRDSPTRGIRRITAVTGAQNTASRRLLERQGFRLAGTVPGTDEVRYTLSLS